jgi:hypothetical protein
MERIPLGIAALIALVAIPALACGDPLTAADETQTAQPAVVASAAAAAEAEATPTAAPATPEPTPTLEDEPTSVPEVYDLPTPASDAEAMALGGFTYVNARPAGGRLVAYIGGQECGRGTSGFMGDVQTAMFTFPVASDAERAGCGVPGAVISFTLDGQAVNETMEWQPGIQKDLVVYLSAGPRFAIYRGTFSLVGGFRSRPNADAGLLVTPYVDGQRCGEAVPAGVYPQDHARFLYWVTVQPNELQAGCGREGASVVLRLQVEGGPSLDLATVPWQTLPVVPVPNVDLRRAIPAVPASTSTAE